MASIHRSLLIAKENEDLIYFVEDDYIHKKESLFEIVSTYEKISSEQNKICSYVQLTILIYIKSLILQTFF